RPFVPGAQLVIRAPVLVSNAASRYRLAPLTLVNAPAMYSRDPSGETAAAITRELMDGLKEPMRVPVSTSYARRFDRGVSLVPAGAPAGRALLNSPPAYTVPPETACVHTMPLICTVGSGSALTVVVTPGSGGAVSALAAGGTTHPATTRPTATATAEPDLTRLSERVRTVVPRKRRLKR